MYLGSIYYLWYTVPISHKSHNNTRGNMLHETRDLALIF